MQDEKNQFTVVTDRAQGAASLASGQLEFLLHFRCVCCLASKLLAWDMVPISTERPPSHEAEMIW